MQSHLSLFRQKSLYQVMIRTAHRFIQILSPGDLVRYLAPGSWNLTFSANGFKDTTISNIVVYDRQKTDLIVNMVPVISGIDTANPVPACFISESSIIELNAILPDQIMEL